MSLQPRNLYDELKRPKEPLREFFYIDQKTRCILKLGQFETIADAYDYVEERHLHVVVVVAKEMILAWAKDIARWV